VILVDLEGDGPLHRRLYAGLRRAILEDRLRPGARLPSSRALARELSLSRNTVLQAYEQLVAEGYAVARTGAGTFVAEALPGGRRLPRAQPKSRSASAVAPSAAGARIRSRIPAHAATWSLPREPVDIDFRYGEPAYADLPMETWARRLGRRARRLSARRLAYQEPGGAPELREALAEYLGRVRGVVCEPDRIIIVHGSQQAIELCTRLYVDPGDGVVLEEPHYTGFSFCAAAAGGRIESIPCDEEGLRVDRLEDVASVKLACVTPSHQFPSGGVLPLARRLALLDWAGRRGVMVLEDDYDGEFRFEGRPLDCLQSLDPDGRVVYVGTASKVLFPALRIGWAVVPRHAVELFRSAKAIHDTGTATLEQLAFADFVAEGDLDRHVRRARRRHGLRRAALLEAMTDELGDRAEVVGADAGVHVLVRLRELSRAKGRALRAACRVRGVGVYPAAPFYSRPPRHAELLLGYAALDESAIREGVCRLRAAIDEVAG
jgi:GntR family transcriptional regulator/MocR family aminotransferase